MDRLFIDDKSGDRKYFTMVPNIVIDSSRSFEHSLYLVMKRIAGEEGVCWAGTRELAKRTGLNRATVRKVLQKLLDIGWIEFIGERNLNTCGGRQPVKCYRIMDIWKQNILHYQGGSIMTHPKGKVGQTGAAGGSIMAQGGSQMSHTKSIKKNIKKMVMNSEFIPDRIPEETREAMRRLRGEL